MHIVNIKWELNLNFNFLSCKLIKYTKLIIDSSEEV